MFSAVKVTVLDCVFPHLNLNLLGSVCSVYLDEDICDAIYECMMIRIKDKFPSIRIQAVLALVRLQDPEDDECPVIDAFIHSMETDTNADVRKTILSNIALSRKTLRHVLGRCKTHTNSYVPYLISGCYLPTL